MSHKELPSIWQLRVFETVARMQSVTRASQELLRSQPATTSSIAGFEELLGAVLFDRSSTGIYLTPVGQTVLVRTRKILASVEEALAAVPGKRNIPVAALAGRITRTQARCLIAVAECGSFRAAAKTLGITEASLQRAARSLEQNLEAELFRHTASGVTTTEVGQEFARRVKIISAQAAALVEAVDAHEFPRERSVTVGVLLLDPAIVIVNAIRETAAAFPGSRVVVLSGTYDALVNKLMREEIDFILGILKQPDEAFGFVEEPLYSETYCVACRPGHPLMARKKITTRQLGDYPWVLPPKGSPRRQAYEHLFAEGAPPPASVETYSLSTIRIALTETDMLTVLSRTEMLSEQKFGMLAQLALEVPWSEPVVGITRHVDWKPNEIQQGFLDSIRRNAAVIAQTLG